MKTLSCLAVLILFSVSAIAAEKAMVKTGTINRAVQSDYYHCFFQEEGSKEELDLWPVSKLKPSCEQVIGKRIKATIRPEKIKIPETEGPWDILRLLKIEKL